MSYQRDREDFIARMTREGLPLDVTRLLLREATGLNRRAELACSSEAANRDRIACPALTATGRTRGYPCLCDHDDSTQDLHENVPRIAVQDWRAEQRIRKALEVLPAVMSGDELYWWSFGTAGDPRGCVLYVFPPSYGERNKNRDAHNLDSIGVPSHHR